ncbi:DNA-directed RNA polymerase V subunit 5C-like [Hibiscus syriacus]|uniref:DNA-directed RNA polymerase V subunit 5C-like n=1 Tax=Hibiscus syriacus TaxID=106335 RepID=A0A6A2YYY2_HIBSY|nr:DNA-directed RNA polymerase V subunit 5C-like [Hibiscus syriacus]
MTRSNTEEPLEPIDPEIERFFRQRRRAQRVNMYQLRNQGIGHEGDQNAEANLNAGNTARPRSIRDHLNPILEDLNPRIMAPDIQVTHFELKPVMFNMLNSIGQFGGMPNEDARQHIRNFLEGMVKWRSSGFYGVVDRFVQIFFAACWDRYKALLRKCSNHGFQDWTQVVMFYNGVNAPTRMMLDASTNGTLLDKSPAEAFDILDRIATNDYQFPSTMHGFGCKSHGALELDSKDVVSTQLAAITNMLKNLQRPSECWDRYKALLRKCSNHGFQDWTQVVMFYNGVNAPTRMMLDAPTNGTLLDKSPAEAFDILDRIATNDYQFPSTMYGFGCKSHGTLDLDSKDVVSAQLAAITNMLKNLQRPSEVREVKAAHSACLLCQGNHNESDCPTNQESINFFGNFNRGNNNPYSNTYNPGWRQHPIFSWGNQGTSNAHQPVWQQNFNDSQGYQSNMPWHNQNKGVSSSLNTSSLEATMQEFIATTKTMLQDHSISIKNQGALLQSHSSSLRALESQVEQYSVLTLRSGTQINFEDKFGRKSKDDSPPTTSQADKEVQDEVPKEEDKSEGSLSKETEGTNRNATTTSIRTPSVQEARPPPHFPQRLKKHNEDVQFKKFVDILSQLQINVPFLEAMEQMPTYAKFLNKLAPKRHDPGSFIIPCSIGNKFDEKALCDLGSNVIVRVDKFVFPVDFLILDCEVDATAPSILGRPFLATGRILIDYERALTPNQESSLLSVLSQYKKALGWTMADLKGISPTICMHKILLEECHGKSIEPHSWVSLVQCVPKKGGMTVVTREDNELIPTRTVIGWQICMDYRKLNKATKKDHFPLPFIDQMLDRLAGKAFYCFLDGYSGYNQIAIAPEDQEKTTFTCPYGTYAFRRMPFGLCNAPVTFQRCMQAIFSDMIGDFLEIFMDDFSVSRDDFQKCLSNLAKVLKRCEEADLVLNWEKCHFMVTEGIVLGHKISEKGIETIHQGFLNIIQALVHPATIESTIRVRSEIPWRIQRAEAKTYLCTDCTKVIVHTDHSAIKYLVNKKNAKPRLIRWILLLQEFNLEVIDRKGTEKQVADHLSRLENISECHDIFDIKEEFPDEKILYATAIPWYADLVNFLVSGVFPYELNSQGKKRFLHDAKFYFWDEPYLFKQCADQMIRRCVPEEEQNDILHHCHASTCGGHFRGSRTATKGIDFMGPFPSSFGDLYILLAVDYVSKWVEAIATPRNNSKMVLKFLHKNIFTRFGVPRAIISDEGTQFDNKLIAKALQKYGVKDWSPKLDEALWAYRTHLKHLWECRPSRWLKLFLGKLKSRWSGPFEVYHVYPYGAIDIKNMDDRSIFKVNGQRLKAYQGVLPACDKSALLLHDVIDDHHASFAQEADNETYQGILEDLCLPDTQWNGQQLRRKTVDRDRLLPQVKLWNHFMKHKLLPTSHNTTVSCQRMLLLHSIISGRPIDVGKIIVEQAHLCLKRQASALVFPNLITALCRKKKVREEIFDEILPGIAGLNKEKIPMLLGYKEAKGNALMEFLPHTNFTIPTFPDELVPLNEDAEASAEVPHPEPATAQHSSSKDSHRPAEVEEPVDPNPIHEVSPDVDREANRQLAHLPEPAQFVESLTEEHPEIPPPPIPMEVDNLEVSQPTESAKESQSEMPRQASLRRSKRRLKKASQHQEPPLPTVQEGPSTSPATPASDSKHSSPLSSASALAAQLSHHQHEAKFAVAFYFYCGATLWERYLSDGVQNAQGERRYFPASCLLLSEISAREIFLEDPPGGVSAAIADPADHATCSADPVFPWASAAGLCRVSASNPGRITTNFARLSSKSTMVLGFSRIVNNKREWRSKHPRGASSLGAVLGGRGRHLAVHVEGFFSSP